MSLGAPNLNDDAAPAHQPPPDPPGENKPNAFLTWIKGHGDIVTVICTVIVVVLGGFLWISEKFASLSRDLSSQMAEVHKDINTAQAEAHKDIADVHSEAAKQGAKLEQIENRLTRLEGRMDAKFGADSPDASAPGPWTPEHVGRRSKFCDQRCKQDAACHIQCVADYNLCGIRCPTNPVTTCFTGCVEALRTVPSPAP